MQAAVRSEVLFYFVLFIFTKIPMTGKWWPQRGGKMGQADKEVPAATQAGTSEVCPGKGPQAQEGYCGLGERLSTEDDPKCQKSSGPESNGKGPCGSARAGSGSTAAAGL